jgi:hypothetical protein
VQLTRPGIESCFSQFLLKHFPGFFRFNGPVFPPVFQKTGRLDRLSLIRLQNSLIRLKNRQGRRFWFFRFGRRSGRFFKLGEEDRTGCTVLRPCIMHAHVHWYCRQVQKACMHFDQKIEGTHRVCFLLPLSPPSLLRGSLYTLHELPLTKND